MKKIVLLILYPILCGRLVLSLLVAKPSKQTDKSQTFRNKVNSDFSITLNQTNSSVAFTEDLSSLRDPAFAACFDLTTEYTHFLEESVAFRNDDTAELLQRYLEPYIYMSDGLDLMLQESKTAHCLVAINIRMDYDCVRDFSLLLLSPESNKLYWFYCTS